MFKLKLKAKKWGNSIAAVIPNNIVKKANIKTGKQFTVFLPSKEVNLEKEFGSLKNWKKPTKKIMEEIDEGWT